MEEPEFGLSTYLSRGEEPLVFKINPSYRKPLSISLALHVVLLLFLVLTPSSKQYRAPSAGVQHPVIQAIALKGAAVDKAVHALERAKHAKQRAEQKALKQLRLAKKRAQKHLATQRAEQKRLTQQTLKSKRLLKKTQHKRASVAAQLAKEKAVQKKLALHRALEKKRLAKQAAALQRELTKTQLAGEKKNLHTAHSRGIFDAYRARIISKIEQQWVIPPGDAASKASCQLLVQLASGGKVTSVTIARSSGRASLDRSARIAVLRASPLPVPTDPALFSSFKTLRLTLRPESLRHS